MLNHRVSNPQHNTCFCINWKALLQENGKGSRNGVEGKSEIPPDAVHLAATFTDLNFIKHLFYGGSRQRAKTDEIPEGCK